MEARALRLQRSLCIASAGLALAASALPLFAGDDSSLAAESGKNWWAFRRLSRQDLPAVEDSSWPKQRVDFFVLAMLASKKLAPSPEASRRELIRRVSFDVRGLPPAPREIDEFLADEAPDAYEKLVDRYLASPQHGERAARRWLDLARYTDTTASWLDSTASAWLYRDWVVRAINDDVPYDRFVVRQLATDSLGETGPDDIPALGFLGLSPTYWKELMLAPDVIERVVAEEWEERIDAIGRTFLGLTVACARCHDHKYDPITQEDYYSLAGVLASTRLVERPIIPPEEARAAAAAHEEVKRLRARIDELKKREEGREKEAASARKRTRDGTPSDENESATREREPAVAELEAEIESIRSTTPEYDTPLANAVEDAALYVLPDGDSRTRLDWRSGVARDVEIQNRGDPTLLGKVVPRRFLAVLSEGEPKLFRMGSGRLELARAIVSDGGSLAARVMANRVWSWYFGRGVVATPSNFGTRGDPPTHPRLLEDLAFRFKEGGWSVRALEREILCSATYRQSSAPRPEIADTDPENRLLARMPRRRLEIEAWRDAMLLVTGELDLQSGGPPAPLDRVENRRRTLYGVIGRRDVDPFLEVHDFPRPEAHSPRRTPTTTPLQQLFFLNAPFMIARASALDERLEREVGNAAEARVRRAYALLYGRDPAVEEIEAARAFVASAAAALGDEKKPESERAAWRLYLQALLVANELLTID